MAMLLNRGYMPESTLSLTPALALSLVVCAASICGLFAIAVRFWPRPTAPTDHSGNDGLAT
jgi:hypothetical protein